MSRPHKKQITMKKTLLIIAVCLIATITAFSQVQFGAGVTAGTKAKINDTAEETVNFGVNARVLWDFSEKFALTGGFSYFLPFDVTMLGVEVTTNVMVFNADAVYYFMDDNDVKVYGLGGVNLASVKAKAGNVSETESEVSWEAGGGVMFSKFFIEAKYDGNLEQIVGTVGIYF